MQMAAKPTEKKEYDVVSRLIVGGRVYLPGTTVTLDENDGQAW